MVSVVRAKVQGPIMEVLEQREYAVLYRERFHKGVRLVLKHYLSDCDYFADVIYIGDDRYLDVYHVQGRLSREEYLSLFLDSETAEQIRKEVMSVKTFEDLYKLFDSLLKATFCKSEKPWLYRICK
jgi:hypothetical protein